MAHHCHATGCTKSVPPQMFACKRHWFSLPKAMRDRIWRAYRPGQCDDWEITHEYAEAAREAVRFLAAKDGVEPDTRVYDMLDPLKPERTPMKPEVLDKIKKLVEEASPQRRIVKADDEPNDRYYVVEADGSLTLKKPEPPATDHTAGSLETLVAVAKSRPGSIIWYSRTGVMTSAAPADPHADKCSIQLEPGPQFSYLQAINGMSDGKSFTQGELIRVLRTTLFGAAVNDLLSSVKKVNIQRGKTVEAEQVRGKVSLARKDIAEMTGVQEVPEQVSFDVPIFSNGTIPARCRVTCDFDLDAEKERFVMTVLPGEIEKAWTTGEQWLETTLHDILGTYEAGDGETAIPVYLGTP